ncbi:MAG: hypothetical protein IJ678_02885 [Kiritimatiellae bacterium]|nr:hypothetical protein [Kiritimatiellia bacterium]
MQNTPAHRNASKGGRPAKFDEPRRQVTMTLPVRILDRLAGIDGDRARAVVRAVEAAAAESTPGRVGELRVGPGEALLVVAGNSLLRDIPWLSLVETSPGRNVLALRDGASIEKLEVAIEDILDSGAGPEADRAVLRELLDRIRTPRRNMSVRTETILVVRGAGKGGN